ncbi:Oidioi.mRNA.OKI2018_I69.chr2.g8227.t1.cds [Oikopleura dioica]|uniref:Oidioi.mRNA.OKI2018_I69.chr2.g8227.t1.cds n=1 Tax=Oikopleura dioica TaxID=34765 RepID=A0ABN7T9L4_OIKDI|nr:Oidioi.mRNA.OKI2018_I69.chr2.g8227.t1.cds [Oikopleura dioica]
MYRTQVLWRGTHLKTRRINTELPIRIHYRINLDAHKSRLPLARIELFPDLGKSIVTCFGITYIADALAQSIWNRSTEDLDQRRMKNMAIAAVPLGIWYSAWFSFLDFHLKKAPFTSALIDTLFLPAVHAIFLIPFHIIHDNKVLNHNLSHAELISEIGSLWFLDWNIFATRFFDNQSKIVSGAADHHVHVTDLTTQEVCYTKSFENRVKKVSVVDNYVFLSAVEDGTVQLSDVRVGASYPIFSISSSNLPRAANITEVKSIDYHKRTNMVAVGSGGGLVRIFDVRFDKEPTVKLMFGKMYFPGHCDRDRGNYSVTHVTFSQDGSELLANMGSEYVYLYDVKNPTLTSLKLPDFDSSPEEPPLLPEKADELKREGNYLFSETQFFGAYQTYLDALRICPGHPVLLNNAASALMNRKIIGDKYESFLFCQRALKKCSKYRKARIRAIKLLRNIDLLAAKAEAEKLLEYDVQNSDKKEVAASRKILDGILKVLDDIPDDEEEEEDGSAPIWLDYKNRFVGHYNCQTDIKEASFLGSEFIAAGSDCGNLFVWRRDGKLLFIAKGDENILNCVQPNPKLTSIATSGIDNEIKLWQPVDESQSDSYNSKDSSNGMVEHVEENTEYLRQHVRQDTELLAHMSSQCVQQ